MKKKEVEKFVDEVGLPLYEELTKIDKEANKWVDSHPEFVTEEIRITEYNRIRWRDMIRIPSKKIKLLNKKNEKEGSKSKEECEL